MSEKKLNVYAAIGFVVVVLGCVFAYISQGAGRTLGFVVAILGFAVTVAAWRQAKALKGGK